MKGTNHRTRNLGHHETIKVKIKGGTPTIILKTLPHIHVPPTQNPPLLQRNKNKLWKILSLKSKTYQ